MTPPLRNGNLKGLYNYLGYTSYYVAQYGTVCTVWHSMAQYGKVWHSKYFTN
jgi:hypothetical protein